MSALNPYEPNNRQVLQPPFCLSRLVQPLFDPPIMHFVCATKLPLSSSKTRVASCPSKSSSSTTTEAVPFSFNGLILTTKLEFESPALALMSNESPLSASSTAIVQRNPFQTMSVNLILEPMLAFSFFEVTTISSVKHS